MMGMILRGIGKQAEAADAFREGIKLVRPYAERYPDGPAGKVLRALGEQLASTQGVSGEPSEGSG